MTNHIDLSTLSPEAKVAFEAVHGAMLTQDAYQLEIALAVRVYAQVLEYICLKPFTKEEERGGWIQTPDVRGKQKVEPASRAKMVFRIVSIVEILDLCGPHNLKHLPTCHLLGLLVGVKESGLSNHITIPSGHAIYEDYGVMRPGKLQAWQFGAPVGGLVP